MASNGITAAQAAILKAAADGPMKPNPADAADITALVQHHLLGRAADGRVYLTPLGQAVLNDNAK